MSLKSEFFSFFSKKLKNLKFDFNEKITILAASDSFAPWFPL